MTPASPLADTHCHLCLDAFRADLEEVLARARQAGVARMLVPGIDLETSRRAVELAEAHSEILAAVGVHPHNASGYTPEVRAGLQELGASRRVVAIGEIGLDYYRDLSPRPQQIRAFEDQLELAGRLGLPVVIHQRAAGEEVLERLLPWSAGRTRPGVLHAFSGDAAQAEAATAAGLYLGLAGPITFPRAQELREVAAGAPHDRVVIETDSPYLTPHPRRGERNEPARVALVAEALARAWASDIEHARTTVWQNADELFRWSDGTHDRHLL